MLQINEIVVRKLVMSLKNPFTTSFGTVKDKEFLLVEIKDDLGNVGYGESVALDSPWYSEETVKTNEHMLEDFLIPLLLNSTITHPDEVSTLFAPIRKNNMAKATLEGAVWDLYAKREGITLANALGGNKKKIDVGISLGIQNTIEDLLQQVKQYVNDGYKRIKIKIKPGYDIEVMKSVRENFPEVAIMADANSAYTLDDLAHIQKLDELNLTMIEQPLAHDDIVDHATLQVALKTPICLDESIHSFEDARRAIELGSCKIINIKIGRVGGLTEAKRIHDYCKLKQIPVWCGGMLESGVGRAHNIALTTLDQFILPGDTASSARYWEEDIIIPEVVVQDGIIEVPSLPGIGYEINKEAVEKFTKSIKYYTAK